MIKKVWDVNKQYAVLGLGRFGAEMVKTLAGYGCEVLAVDSCEECANALKGIATHTATADVSDESVLRSLDIDKFDVVVIAIGENVQASIVCALCCKELNAKYVVAKAQDEKHAKILSKIGVDKVVLPEADSAQRTAVQLFNPNVSEVIEMKGGYSIAELRVPDAWKGRDIASLNIRSNHKINILLVVSPTDVFVPAATTVFGEEDKAVVGGMTDDMDRFLQRMAKK